MFRPLPAVMFLALAAVPFCIPTPAAAYPVGPPVPLDKLSEQADLICKVEAVASQRVEDDWFRPVSGFDTLETTLRVMEVYRGGPQPAPVRFRHYAMQRNAPYIYQPQHYEFIPGRVYLVCACRGNAEGTFRQLWLSHTMLEDQGVWRAATREPHGALPFRQVLYRELIGLLSNEQRDDVTYALRQLDWLSGGVNYALQEFPRDEILAAMVPLLQRPSDDLVTAVLQSLGARSPYLRDDLVVGWLATRGQGHLPGFSRWEEPAAYPAGQRYGRAVAAVVDSSRPVAVRALAVRALGRSCRPEVLAHARRWLRDPEPSVVQAAAMLLGDYPQEVNLDELRTLARDSRPAVRTGAAQAIGLGQLTALVPELARLLDDPAAPVVQAAAISLLSLPHEHSRGSLLAHRRHDPFGPLFINALAHYDPAPYLDELSGIVETRPVPRSWWGGFTPWADSWDMLFNYVQAQPEEDLRGGKFDRVLRALEAPAAGADGRMKYYSSSEPRDLYALYLQRGMKERAQAFRTLCERTSGYDIGQFFAEVVRDPGRFTRYQRVP